MPVWEFSFTIKQFVLDFAVVSVLLIAATMARSRIPILQRFLIPSNLIAGFLGLILGPELLKWIEFSPERMGVYVYHLLALTFIGVGLKRTGGRTVGAIHIGFIKVLTFVIQALIGLIVALFFLWLISPNLVPAVGILLPLGFGMGPGIAFSIGQSWEAHGFAEAADIGLTLAAIGFLVAYITGISVVNRGIHKGLTTLRPDEAGTEFVRRGFARNVPPGVGSHITFSSGTIDTLTFHFALVGAVYLAAYGVVLGLEQLLSAAGLTNEIPTLWSLNFVVANLLALGTRKIIEVRKAGYMIDDGTLRRITGLLADILVAAAIMAISLKVTWQYVGPIAVMCIIGAVATYFAIKWPIGRLFSQYRFERTVGLYAEQTGTISSGLAMIRVTDPEFATPVAQDQALGSGAALALGFPLLIMINLPLVWYEGSLEGYFTMAGLLVLYLFALIVTWFIFTRRTAGSIPGIVPPASGDLTA